MSQILDDPFIMSAVLAAWLPLVTAVIFTGIGGMTSARAAGCAIAIAFLIAHLSIFGWPPFPPRSSLQKIVYISIAGLVLGIVFEVLGERVPIRPLAVIWSAVIVVWLGWQQLVGWQALGLVQLALIWLAGAFV